MTQLHAFLHSCPLFQGVSPEGIKEISTLLSLKKILASQILYDEQQPPEGMYIVVEGRLALCKSTDPKKVWELGSTDHTGDSVMLTHVVQPLKVLALRDTELYLIPKENFLPLLQKYPVIIKNICKELSFFLHQSIAGVPPQKKRVKTIAFVGKYAKELLGRLSRYMPEYSLLDESGVQKADQIVIVSHEKEGPALTDQEKWLAGYTLARQDLVLLHGENRRPSHTHDWLAVRKVRSHQHLFIHEEASYQRLARILSGKSIGVVFSGGGARGIAQIGFLQYIVEKGVPVDFVGGCSIGAIIAALYALGWDAKALDQKTKNIFIHEKGIIDYTFPYAALLKGEKAYEKIVQHTEGAYIEDLPTTFFCVSSNLTRKEEELHFTGPLSEALRASIALPGIFPPIFYHHQLLADGGLFNVLPVETMVEHTDAAKIIAIDVSGQMLFPFTENFPSAISGWKIFRERKKKQYPTLSNILLKMSETGGYNKKKWTIKEKLAQHYIRLPVEKFPTLAFHDYDALKKEGYEYARNHWAEWTI